MSLNLKELQRVVRHTVKNERNVGVLQEEILRVFGHAILTSRGLTRMAKSVNEHLDVLEVSGKSYKQIKPSLLINFINSEDVEVRCLVARLIPETFLKPLMKDANPAVRMHVAKRSSLSSVKEMSKRFPQDDMLRTICRAKVNEAGLPDPKVADKSFDMYGEKPMRDMTGDYDFLDLSDVWYDQTAFNIVRQYGNNIEARWEEITVKNYCDSMKSMGVDVDCEKLLDAVYSCRDEASGTLVKESLRNLVTSLRTLDHPVMPIISETIDHVKKLISSNYASREFIEKFEESFDVRYTTSLNPAYKMLVEGPEKISHPITVASSYSSFREIEEQAVETYVKAWNFRECPRGTSHKLSWSYHPEKTNIIKFNLELKR